MFINCDNLSGYVTIKILPSRHTSRYVARIIGYVVRIADEKIEIFAKHDVSGFKDSYSQYKLFG